MKDNNHLEVLPGTAWDLTVVVMSLELKNCGERIYHGASYARKLRRAEDTEAQRRWCTEARQLGPSGQAVQAQFSRVLYRRLRRAESDSFFLSKQPASE